MEGYILIINYNISGINSVLGLKSLLQPTVSNKSYIVESSKNVTIRMPQSSSIYWIYQRANVHVKLSTK